MPASGRKRLLRIGLQVAECSFKAARFLDGEAMGIRPLPKRLTVMAGTLPLEWLNGAA